MDGEEEEGVETREGGAIQDGEVNGGGCSGCGGVDRMGMGYKLSDELI